jgi:thioredoxin 1
MKKSVLLIGMLISTLTLAACKPVSPATNEPPAAEGKSGSMMREMGEDAVMMKSGKMMMRKDGSVTMMEEETTLDDGTKVMMDGKIMKPDGMVMKLEEGMMMEMDGDLRMMDGAILDRMMKGSTEDRGEAMQAPAAGEGAMKERAVYADYADAVLADGKTKVLFFHAAWCPICKDANAKLQSWFPSAEFSRSIYKVDYDTATALKAKYGVTYQHTFVLVDGQGTMLSKLEGPTDEQLMSLLQ